MKLTGLFDGDILAYRAGFAAEKTYYFDSRKPPENGGRTWQYKKEIISAVPPEFIDKARNLEPIENALYNVKSLVNNSLEALEYHYDTGDIEYETFVSGNKTKQNFRKSVDEEYKANRTGSHRPTYLPELLEYIIEHHNGYSTEGCEADDFFGHACITARERGRTPVIISIDKDLQQIAGHHYHPIKNLFSIVSSEEADLVFWRQMLQGDDADNIPGISGIGNKRVKRYLPNGTTNKAAQDIVIKYYKRDFKEGWKERYNKNAQLLWIWKKIPDECPFQLQDST
jgi:5'-3' exonuclease